MGIKVTELIEALSLETVNEGPRDGEISAVQSNRCGLQLTGFYRQFQRKRVQVIGNAETEYLETLDTKAYEDTLGVLISHEPPCIVLGNGNTLSEAVVGKAKEAGVWILRTQESTAKYIIEQTIFLQSEMAERITLHGVLVDVYGVGILLTGESGIGKSETAIDLIRHGHMLIADDAVEIKKISANLLVGTSHELTRNLIECRGIGIVNINSLFGKSAIRLDGAVNLVVHLVKWDDDADYDRVHGDFSTKDILGIDLPMAQVAVRPGRNLASIVEIAALNFRQNQMGYNTASELDRAAKRFHEVATDHGSGPNRHS